VSTCDLHTLPASVANHRTESPLRSPRERHASDAASTVTTVSVRRQPRKESQTDASRTLLNPSLARHYAAAAHGAAAMPAVPAQIAHGAGRLAPSGALASMLATAARQFNVARRPSWIALVATAVAAGVLVWWVMIARQPSINADAVVRNNLAAAQSALHEGRYTDPSQRSALHYFSTVLAIDPTNAAAINGVDAIADHYLDDAKRFIIDGQYAPAALALEKVRRIRPEHRRLPLLDAQLRRELKELLAQQREASAAQELLDAAKDVPAKTRTSKATGSQDKGSQDKAAGLMAALAPAPAVSSALTQASATASAAVTPAAVSTSGASGASEGANSAPEIAPEASVRNSVTGTSNADESAAGATAAAIAGAGAAGAAAVANVGGSSEDIAVAATPAAPGAAVGAGSASGAAVSPDSPPPVAAPTPETRSAPAPAQRTLLRFVQPDYPNEALLRGYEGWVDLSLDVTPAGVVLNPRVDNTNNGRIFNRAALAAVRQWRYQPRDGGTGEPEHIKVRVEFKLSR
jgi:TonB family protein